MKTPNNTKARRVRRSGWWPFVGRALLLGATIAVIMSGCATKQMFVEDHRLARYRPDDSGVVLGDTAVVVEETRVEAPPVVKERTPMNPIVVTAGAGSPGGRRGTASGASKPAPPQGSQRFVQRGDELRIYLTGIPKAQEIIDVVDDLGRINLPFIGNVVVEGRSTSEVESQIQNAYIRGGYFKEINIIVVPQMEEYFVQGEVQRQSKYFLSGDLTLLQAISEAGGYTPFANKKKIKVLRNGVVSFYNGKDIAEGKLTDPIIKAGDIIVVQKRWY